MWILFFYLVNEHISSSIKVFFKHLKLYLNIISNIKNIYCFMFKLSASYAFDWENIKIIIAMLLHWTKLIDSVLLVE